MSEVTLSDSDNTSQQYFWRCKIGKKKSINKSFADSCQVLRDKNK